MKDNNMSKTAEMAAATRAIHYLHHQEKVFEDPYAIEFCGDRWRHIINIRPLRWFVLDIILKAFYPVAVEIIGRSRYTEDLLEQAISSGVDQYVIIGSGFDSFVLRRKDLKETVKVFEIDFPATQQAKQGRLLTLDEGLPENLHFVGIDFEKESISDGLKRTNFQTDRPAFFSWLGTIYYISREATLNTLSALVDVAAPGSQLVFDYYIPQTMLAGEDRKIAEKISSFVARRGEPLIGFYAPEEMKGILDSMGMRMLENFSPSQQQDRYWSNRSDGFETFKQAYFSHAKVL